MPSDAGISGIRFDIPSTDRRTNPGNQKITTALDGCRLILIILARTGRERTGPRSQISALRPGQPIQPIRPVSTAILSDAGPDRAPVPADLGERDSIIPVSHGHATHERMPNGRLEVFPRSGRFPQLDEPERFLDVLVEFIDSTEPAAREMTV
jgi:pimeloyl-ACP methyl ester carboxylesterase